MGPSSGTHLYRMEEKEGRTPKSLPVELSMLPLGKLIPFDRSPLVGWADGTKFMLSPNGRSCWRSLGNVEAEQSFGPKRRPCVLLLPLGCCFQMEG